MIWLMAVCRLEPMYCEIVFRYPGRMPRVLEVFSARIGVWVAYRAAWRVGPPLEFEFPFWRGVF